MNFKAVIYFLFATAVLSAWYFTRPPSYISGQVEKQIHGVGAELAPALATNGTFIRTVNGYQPKLELPQAPAGLKPVEARAWTAMAQRQSGETALALTFPEHYSSGTQARGQGMAVTLKPLGSNAASAQVENGKLVYHDAYPATDSLQVASDGRSEEFLLLKNAQAPQRFDYDLSAVSGVKNISLSDDAVHFTNPQGQQMQIEAPWLIESGGKKVANAVHWQLSYPGGQSQPHLALVVANAGKLHYPVVIDPTWVVTTGGLNTGRFQHTATLLNNGQVLITGGSGNGGVTASAELYIPPSGTFVTIGNLNTARALHTATLLTNGEVLIAGGYNNSGAVSSAELFNPLTDTFTSTGNLFNARQNHTATLLNNGRVLVAGGYNGGYLSSGEIYFPDTGTWSSFLNLNTARSGHTATLLANGQVLFTGGQGGAFNNPTTLRSAEIFNPSNGSFTYTTGNMQGARSGHTATLLPNGQVLIVGGGGVGNSAELFNPATGSFTNTTGAPNYPRFNHTASLLPNGLVLLAGGEQSYINPGPFSDELFNPATGTFTVTGTLNTERSFHAATLLLNGLVLVTGGIGSNSPITSAELYDPAAGSFSLTTGNLTTTRLLHTATLLPNGKVLITGGVGLSGYLNSAELFNPATGSFTATTGNLNAARASHTATLLPNGKVLIAGGSTGNGSYVGSAELYNPATDTFAFTTGNLNTARENHTATLLPSGQVLLAGGYNGNYLGDAELYNPATGTFTDTFNLAAEPHTANPQLNSARANHTATLLPDGQVLFVGGESGFGGSTSPVQTAELYNPATYTFTNTGNLNFPRYYHTATLLPSGQVLIAGGVGNSGGPPGNAPGNSAELYTPGSGTFTNTGNLNTGRSEHTATLLLNGQVLVAGGQLNSGTPFSAEIYNPATGVWTATGNLNTNRFSHTATLLSNGQVLVSGGIGSSSPPLNTAELFDPGLGYGPATQPQLNTITTANSTSALDLTGTNFTGVSEASGGATNNSASNIPIVALQSLVNEQKVTLSLDPSQGFSSTSFTSLPQIGLVPGYALLTMYVNGTPSLSQIVFYSLAAQTISGFPATQTLALSASPYTLPATTSSGQTITYSIFSGPATVSGNILTFTGTGTVIVTATQAGDGTYAPLSATETITVTNPPPAIATDTPTMPQWGLAVLAVLLMIVAARARPTRLATR